MHNIFFDSETCGLHGLAILFQYAEEDGPITLYNIWDESIIDTLHLIEYFLENNIIFFNATFDFFHICKIYTIFTKLLEVGIDPNTYPEDIIDTVAKYEAAGRDGPCLKPASCSDLMLWARKGKYQATMDRKDVRIRRIPNQIAWELAEYIENKITFSDIFFARRKDKHAPKWAVYDRKDDPDFKDIVLKFRASSALKNLAIHALGVNPAEVLRFGDIEVDRKYWPIDLGYAPFATAISSKAGNWTVILKKANKILRGFSWPAVIRHHISHWYSNELARQYASDDIKYTRALYYHLAGPEGNLIESNDDDSVLACMVGAVRWKGFAVDLDKIKELRNNSLEKIISTPKDPTKVRAFLNEVLDDTEKLVIKESTKKIILEEIAKWENDGPEGTVIPHPAAIRAQRVLDARQAKSRVDNYDKLLRAGRFHASLVIIGTMSSRMAGTDDFNAQGIPRNKEVRSCFTLHDTNSVLCGGDMVSFEMVIASAVYKDPILHRDLQSGKKLYGIFGAIVFEMSYDDVMNNKDTYTRSKSGTLAMIYGGEAYTLKTKFGVTIEVAEKAYQKFIQRFKGVGIARKIIFDKFCSMRQVGGIGTKVEWHEPSEYIESIFGFKRYYTLENQVCKALYELANKPPKHWRSYRGKVIRRDRVQTVSGSVQSALYAAAFGIQASSMRSASNHVIQSSGAQITKKLQRNIWDLQPSGVHNWIVMPFNSHDEIMTPTHPDHIDEVSEVVKDTIDSFIPQIPLLAIDWHTNMHDWSEK
jgi:hypothetical protein